MKILEQEKICVKNEIFPREIGRKIGEEEEIPMLAIMMISILQVWKKQNGKL